jgi:hypothetical protein
MGPGSIEDAVNQAAGDRLRCQSALDGDAPGVAVTAEIMAQGRRKLGTTSGGKRLPAANGRRQGYSEKTLMGDLRRKGYVTEATPVAGWRCSAWQATFATLRHPDLTPEIR